MTEKPGKYADECFFIAPIGEEGSEIRERSDGVMEYIVRPAAEEFELKVERADRIATPGLINLQVIGHVIGARAAVADLTGLNPNVFYEMAIRHTANLPLVLIAEKGTDLPFDIAQMRTIFFDHKVLKDADMCRKEIVKHLREALENDVVDSPIETAIDLERLTTGSPSDRSVAELVTTVEQLSRNQREFMEFIDFRLYESQRTIRSTDIPRGLVESLHSAVRMLQEVEDPDERVLVASRLIDDAADFLSLRASPRRVSPRRPSTLDEGKSK